MHRHLTDAQKIQAGGEPDVARLSIGLEDKDDIIADLEAVRCPKCWIVNETRSSPGAIPSQGAREDYFRCLVCGFELAIPF